MTDSSITYSIVPGFFQQSGPTTKEESFDYTKTNFGLTLDEIEKVNASPTDPPPWQRFTTYINNLNNSSPPGTSYKLLFLARHGQGDHNVAESKFGTKAWDDHYSLLDSHDGLTFFDAHLTTLGIEQARAVHDFWTSQLRDAKMPAPESYYCSPLFRCLQTAETTFKGLDLPSDRPFKPKVKELLRECIGIHTCDRRSPLTHLRSSFPGFSFPEDMAEEDEMWRADFRETDNDMLPRFKELLDNVFIHDGATFVSFTAHSGAIKALLTVLGHRAWVLPTGGVVPVFVKAERGDGGRLPKVG